MENTCADICAKLCDLICFECPKYAECMPEDDDEVNHDQLLVCMDSLIQRLSGEYPNEIDCPCEE
jgi:hypothetical protein